MTASEMLPPHPSESVTPVLPDDLDISLRSVFHPSCVEVIRGGSGKSSVISLLVRILAREQHIDRSHAEAIVRELLDRERHSTSAIGRGLAFPHLRTHEVEHFVGAIGVAPDGIDFGALDGEPTKLVLLTLSPWQDREQHMALLSRLVSLMQNKAVSLQLTHRLNPKDVYEYLTDLDHRFASPSETETT